MAELFCIRSSKLRLIVQKFKKKEILIFMPIVQVTLTFYIFFTCQPCDCHCISIMSAWLPYIHAECQYYQFILYYIHCYIVHVSFDVQVVYSNPRHTLYRPPDTM